jgi:hypothetical protein
VLFGAALLAPDEPDALDEEPPDEPPDELPDGDWVDDLELEPQAARHRAVAAAAMAVGIVIRMT